MAIRTVQKLKEECEALGLCVEREGDKFSKQDYIKVLQKHFLPQEVSFGMKYRLSLDSLQLARQSTTLTEKERDMIFKSDEWVMEEKLDGVRMLVCYSRKYGFELYSRNISVKDFLPVSYSDKFWYNRNRGTNILTTFVLDCEITSNNSNLSTIIGKRGVVTETVLQAVTAVLSLNTKDSVQVQKELGNPLVVTAFDCLYVDGRDLQHEDYFTRRQALNAVVKKLNFHGVPFQKTKAVSTNKKSYLKKLWAAGGEGGIAKNINQGYLAKSSRPKNGWIKFKKTVSGDLGDTVDGYITGFEPGRKGSAFEKLVGALHISIKLEKLNGDVVEHMIARTANMPLAERKRISYLDGNGKVRLIDEYFGKVVEVEGQAISSRVLRLVHPRLIRFRIDKSILDCVEKESDLRQLIK